MMNNNHSQARFKKFLDLIKIDVSTLFDLSEIPEEYYSMRYYPPNSLVDTPIDSLLEIWSLVFNGNTIQKFFDSYSFLENNLIAEVAINHKFSDSSDDENLFKDLCNWFNEKISKITYLEQEDLFICDFIQYGYLFNKLTFNKSYNSEIQDFITQLKGRLIQTYTLVIDKAASGTFKPNLKWEGSDTDLIDLVTALCVNKSISLKEGNTTWKALMLQFEQIFDIEIKHRDSKLSRTTTRMGDESIFLNKLQTAYTNYSVEKLEKKEKRNR